MADTDEAIGEGSDTPWVETAEWWRTLVDAAADAILIHSEGRIIFANRRAAELFGAGSPQALLGRVALDLVHPASRATAAARTSKLLTEGGSCPPLELRFRRDDGSWFWGEGRPAAVHYRGRPAVLVIIRDVSERRRQEQRLRDFAELASDWFWETGPDLRYTWFSPDVEHKTGVPAAWHLGKTRAEIAGPDSDPEVIAENMRLMQARRPYRDFVFQRRGPTGDHWIRSNGKPVFDEDGRFLGYRGTGRDITAEIEAERRLRESEERYRRLVELAPDGVIVHVEGCIRYANQRAASLLGVATAVELIGRSVLEFVPPSEHERIRRRWRQLRQGEAVPPAEVKVIRADGIERWVEVRATAISDRGESAVLLIATDVSDRRRSEERLVYLARHDALTGLANRMLVVDRLEQAVRLAVREGQLAALLLLDLDGFKGLNDTFGHLFGDRVLQWVADRMRGELRSCDTVGRLGGDEFAIVLPRIQSPADADLVAERLARSLSQPFSLDGRSCRIAASIGIALGPEHATSAEGLLRCADLALYRAKARGRGGWVMFERSMLAAVERQRVIEAALRRHLADGSLQVHYQPLVELASGRIVGAEALVRWPSDDSEQLPPEVFVSVAEESGLIGDLGRLVLTRALADFREFCTLAGRLLRVSVNISPHELVDRDYARKVQAILAQAGVPGELLELEITERVLLERRGEIAEVLASLRSAGVQLAIDDFGTGYSSLTYLKHLPVHRLKLDRTFVSGLPDDGGDRAIVEAIIGLARAFRLPVIAEGVERLQQVECLRRLGVQDAQGYYWAPPLPRDAFAELLLSEAGGKSLLPLAVCAPGMRVMGGHALIASPTA